MNDDGAAAALVLVGLFIVMMVIEPLKLCPNCTRPTPTGAQVCPYCAYNLAAATPGTPPAA